MGDIEGNGLINVKFGTFTITIHYNDHEMKMNDFFNILLAGLIHTSNLDANGDLLLGF